MFRLSGVLASSLDTMVPASHMLVVSICTFARFVSEAHHHGAGPAIRATKLESNTAVEKRSGMNEKFRVQVGCSNVRSTRILY